MNAKNYKVVLIGDVGCGKTALLERYGHGEFIDKNNRKIIDNFIKEIEYRKNITITLSLWDTPGEDKLDSVRFLSYEDCDFFIICFALDNRKSLLNVKTKWVKEIKLFRDNIPYVLAGLKSDLVYRNKKCKKCKKFYKRKKIVNKSSKYSKKKCFISYKTGKKVASIIGALEYVECSSLTNKNVDFVFKITARELVNVKNKFKNGEEIKLARELFNLKNKYANNEEINSDYCNNNFCFNCF